ncbi:Pyridoxine 4-dehydrogenase [Asimina triloba]
MGFGTWAWGNQLLWGYQEAMEIGLQETFNLAVRNGINLFDTADSYGTGRLNGQSEKLLGKFIREFQDRLQIEKIGIGQLHWSTANYAPLQELALWDGLVAMYEKGLVQAVGVSNYGPKQLLKIHSYLKVRGVPLCSAQLMAPLVKWV